MTCPTSPAAPPDRPAVANTLSIVIPAYNEAGRLPSTLEAVDADGDRVAADAALRLHELIVVDDGSTDGTAGVVAAHPALAGRLRLVRHASHRGKGAAVRTGMAAATGDRALVMDADLSTPLEALGVLSAALDRGADIAIGSRSVSGSVIVVHQPRHRENLGRLFNVALRATTGLAFRDTQCGFKLFRRETTAALFERLRIDGFAFDAELCVLARRQNLTTVEVPVSWTNDPDSRVALVGSSSRMALDLLRIAWLARVSRADVRPRGSRGRGRRDRAAA